MSLACCPDASKGEPEGLGYLRVLARLFCRVLRRAGRLETEKLRPMHALGSLVPSLASAHSALFSCETINLSPSSPDPDPESCEARSFSWMLRGVCPPAGTPSGALQAPQTALAAARLLGARTSRARKRAPGSTAFHLCCCGLQRLPCCTLTRACRDAH